MVKLIKFFVFGVYLFTMHNSFAQKKANNNQLTHKHTIGIQLNPYIDGSNFSYPYPKQYTFAIRYSYYPKSNITFGTELSGNYLQNESLSADNFGIGVFFRYSFLAKKKVVPFVEASTLYNFGKTHLTAYNPAIDEEYVYTRQFGYYVAPGISINLWKKRVFLDISAKLSTIDFFFGGKITPSYKLQYKF